MHGDGERFPLIVTDLDGTLLDANTYDWSPAADVVMRLRAARIPLVLASSKTRAEIAIWRERLTNDDPYVVENGGAVYIPSGSLGVGGHPTGVAKAISATTATEERIVFGTEYATLRAGLVHLSRQMKIGLRGFGDLSTEEVARITDLKGNDLQAAREREFDEPFVPMRPLRVDQETRLEEEAALLDLRITRGGRFHHLTGRQDKGTALRYLRSRYSEIHGDIIIIVLGDGENDREALLEADFPVIVARPDGSHAPALVDGVPHARRTVLPGPAGFAHSITEILQSFGAFQ